MTWQGEGGQQLRAQFALRNGQPVVQELAARQGSGAWIVLGKDLIPGFPGDDGTAPHLRCPAQQLKSLNLDTPEQENVRKWNTFWDAPLVVPGGGDTTDLPRSESEITRGSVSYQSSTCTVASERKRVRASPSTA
jgi:hypothetical protein